MREAQQRSNLDSHILDCRVGLRPPRNDSGTVLRFMERGKKMATSKRAKSKAKKKAKAKDAQECISCLLKLHELQGVLLKELDKCPPKKA